MPIDLLAGTSRLRAAIDAGMPAGEIAGEWEDEVQRFNGVRGKYLLY
jgi:uncharacterized protein YbbC (DUF1343 family)